MYKRFFAEVLLLSFMLLLSACSFQADQEPPSRTLSPSPTLTEPTAPPEVTPEPTKEPEPTNDPDPAEEMEAQYREILKSMSLEEKLGQLLIVGYPGDEHAGKMIRDYKVGGIVLFSRNFETFEQLYQITQQLKEYNRENKLPLWIALDEEGGRVSRLPSGKTPIPDARKVGSYDDTELTKAVGWVIGREIAAAGANLDFAPVVDVVDNPENEFMLNRSYGSTPEMVARHGAAFLQGLKETGIQGCAKHFPGHGGTGVDSHKDMPVIDSTLEQWLQKDAVTFREMIDAGVDMIMVGHLAFPNIDPSGLPASMSSVFLKELLRGRMGYEGLVITDDIEMKGYPQGQERKEAIITTFLAGMDLFAIGQTPQTQLDVLEALKEGVRTGQITEERIDESLIRIIRTKMKLNKIQEYSMDEARQIFGSEMHKEAVSELMDN